MLKYKMGPGGFHCVRGGLIDLFPMGSVLPYRIAAQRGLLHH